MNGENEKEAVMEVRGICKSFGPTIALKNVDITVRRGEIRGLIGENGSGKSTVTSIYAGIQPADFGEMFFLGKPWHPHSMVGAMNSGVGMIVQETGTVPDITVAENMFLGEAGRFRMFSDRDGGGFGPVSGRKLYRAAQKALDDIGASHIKAEMITGSLDMQERKLVEIAKVWMKNPELIVVDETSTALSQRGREIIYDLMNRMRDEDKAVVFISHDIDEIMEKCNALTVLRDGKIIRTFTKEEFDEDAIRSSMIGRELQGSYYRDDSNSGFGSEVVLEIKDGTYRDRIIDCSLSAHKGEILGIGGLSHCGMHTLGKALYGAVKLDRGSVLVRRRKADESSSRGADKFEVVRDEHFAMKCGIGYVAKDRDTESLNMVTTIRDNVAIAGLDIIKTKSGLIFSQREKDYVERNIDALSTKYFSIDQPVSNLSGGNKQKVVFAKWIGCGSDILILDCPTRGVDIGVKQAMYQLLYKMKLDGKTIVMISEEKTELMGMCDRLIIMKDGRIKKEFTREDGYDENEIIKYMI